MTMTVHLPEYRLNGHDWRRTMLLMLLPALLAAGMMDHPATDPALPEADSYRTPLPDTIFESNQWRRPRQEERDWRLPPPPPPAWRTPQSSQSESSSTRTIELFPRYQPGKPSDFDLTEHEEKPLIRMFEFGSK